MHVRGDDQFGIVRNEVHAHGLHQSQGLAKVQDLSNPAVAYADHMIVARQRSPRYLSAYHVRPWINAVVAHERLEKIRTRIELRKLCNSVHRHAALEFVAEVDRNA